MAKNNKLKTINHAPYRPAKGGTGAGYKLITIVGPTASGKSEVAIKLALRLGSGQAKKFGIKGAEIISADSRQVYRGMNIGTGKITKKEMSGIPHYLINIVYPNEKFNVAIYKKLAIKAIKDIQKRGKLPFLVGGTGLYIQAVVDNIEFPKVPPQKRLREKLEKKSAKELFKIYKKIDEEGAKCIEKENKRRLIRAIEVCTITGKSFWQQRQKGAKLLFDILEIGIKLTKRELKTRIKKRVEKMFKMGLEKEAKYLIEEYGQIPSLQTIGYQEWQGFFEGKIGKEKVKELIILHTIQFAKRQMTWFKRHPAPEQVRYGASKRIHWIKNYKQAEILIKNFLKK